MKNLKKTLLTGTKICYVESGATLLFVDGIGFSTLHGGDKDIFYRGINLEQYNDRLKSDAKGLDIGTVFTDITSQNITDIICGNIKPETMTVLWDREQEIANKKAENAEIVNKVVRGFTKDVLDEMNDAIVE